MDIKDVRELIAAGLEKATGTDVLRALCAVELELGGEIHRDGWSDTCENLDRMAVDLLTEAMGRIG